MTVTADNRDVVFEKGGGSNKVRSDGTEEIEAVISKKFNR